MAAQSLYRRYRPRRFSELKGQPHVVRALKTAVLNHREGQAYLFSGPRGTGKTTSARILAKVLNCERPQDGEPCCECESCLAVEAGTSYDVHELDAASNNGVDAMRDLIEKASLGTPGRHKVYILDEVHMLSRPAEAALLKTLEEPPPHVVFVLATTDPQKISDTIRSRTQHLQFHLLPPDELEAHVRWVAADAGIELDDTAIAAVVRQGGGSARDTLSSLELAAASGGVVDDGTPVDEFVDALEAADAARVLAAVAFSVQQGRDPRALTEDLVRHLRDCFLSLMAPELVQLPAARLDQIGAQAARLGAAALVKAMEVLGEALVEMRHAPDPRVLVEVALVRLTHRELDTGMEGLAARIEHLERELARVQAGGPPAGASGGGAGDGGRGPAAPPVDPATGRARLGSRAARSSAAPASRPSEATGPGPDVTRPDLARPAETRPAETRPPEARPAEARSPDARSPEGRSPEGRPTEAGPAAPGTPAQPAGSAPSAPAASSVASSATAAGADGPAPSVVPPPAGASSPVAPAAREVPAASAPAPSAPPAGTSGPSSLRVEAPGGGAAVRVVRAWASDVLPALKGLARALYSAAPLVGERDGAVVLAPPNDVQRAKCEEHRAAVESVMATVGGAPVRLVFEVGAAPGGEADGSGRAPSGRGAPGPAAAVAADDPFDDVIDPAELSDAPPVAMQSPVERLTQAFPGSELIEGGG